MEEIKISTIVNADIKSVWEKWILPEHIKNWYYASEDWHCPKVENDLKENGNFNIRMEAKDGSMGFDFEGFYTEVVEFKYIAYKMTDGRKVGITFSKNEKGILITETFEAETQNSIEMQKQGWQAILDNFKKYAEEKN
ncbi:uncharacterized protein YndB with AHSA1/START domain [Gillisia mitskevichiae]|uniref:Uncharacterized protein YndB with AHSA1/START domain n=1 Tax=Gillisia mitskevichiae TaxID=270921 RepID=A0A495PS74_9FLAO|nr:SRPBCC family protein [Gillisia mitskevichiae]RKS53391.1 uncharacterized protein YndB with AHSA1/START domain [Gillisia mitskevichiae]